MFETPEYLYQEIAESFRRQIASGELAPADKLPPIRKLASTWSCTPGTVSRAYRILADEGLVVGHRGKGTRVAANVLQRADRRGGKGASNELRWARLINRAEQFRGGCGRFFWQRGASSGWRCHVGANYRKRRTSQRRRRRTKGNCVSREVTICWWKMWLPS